MTRRADEHRSDTHAPDELGSSQHDRSGQIVDRYEITRRIGGGGMGEVYEARHTKLRRRFAIKFLRPHLTLRPEILTRFTREARAAGSLESEHLTATIDLGETADGTPYIVMEYLDGEDLARLLARTGQLSVQRAIGIAIQTCRGLSVAHGRGIVHRDLKPSNLFVSRHSDGTDLVRVLDFGIAKLNSLDVDESTLVTSEGQLLGTPAYMAPEQARGLPGLDEGVDVYAVGAILYEMLSGQKAHPGRARNEVLYHVLTQPIARLASLRSDVPDELVRIVERALASNPRDRYASVDDLAVRLEVFAPRRQSAEHANTAAAADESTLAIADSIAPHNSMPVAPHSVRISGSIGRAVLLLIAAGVLVLVARVAVKHAEQDVRLLRAGFGLGELPLRAALNPNRFTAPGSSDGSASAEENSVSQQASTTTQKARAPNSATRKTPATRKSPPSRTSAGESAGAAEKAVPGSLADDIYKP
jgi:serine/threonine protein kinase